MGILLHPLLSLKGIFEAGGDGMLWRCSLVNGNYDYVGFGKVKLSGDVVLRRDDNIFGLDVGGGIKAENGHLRILE
ncbi:hypothetical protein L1887_17979 [Cichorium endivia]|nr:hypothetical protein L1887_17979 [Cichorium endivia]